MLTSPLIVALGASAGGIQALKEFFEHMPPDAGMAYVVILHLSPDHDSQLAELLQYVTEMPVQQVMGKTKIEPDRIYVIPPDKHLTLEDGAIIVSPNTLPEERRAPVDIFFRSLAEAYKSRAVAVVLSGTGANGSMGLKRVKEDGGAVFVQNPREAEFNEMPRNAIATDLVDEVLNVAMIPGRILAYRDTLADTHIEEVPEKQADSDQQALREIFTQLRMRTGHDFSAYKRATLLRRIGRRMAICVVTTLPEYAGFCEQHPEETQALLKDLLISVTNFFRDKTPFTTIEEEILPAIFEHKTTEDQVRIWVAGCATGEEAYTLAMLCAERSMGVPDAPKVQVIATDIDEAAIAAARDGFYTLNDAADVSQERLSRFFTREGEGYRIRREIRETILFAHHNFLKDPPFSRIDLVSCRNVLIYLNRPAQERVMETFHFALKPEAYLLLGTSESVDMASDLFHAVSREQRIYQSRITARQRPYIVPDTSPLVKPFVSGTAHQAPRAALPEPKVHYSEMHLKSLEQYAPPSVVVNADFDIVHASPGAGRYLQFVSGAPTQSILKLIRDELRAELRNGLYGAVQRGVPVSTPVQQVRIDERPEAICIHVRPVTGTDNAYDGFLLVVFEPAADSTGEAPFVTQTSDETAAQHLETEIVRLRAQLRASDEQHEFQAEELKAGNEELQAMNEELRSATEELETSKEELQSINEELSTVNQELKVKVEEATMVSNNLQNLINSTDIGTIFLDRSLRVVLFTPAVRSVFSLIPADYGRPLADIRSRLPGDGLLEDAENVLQRLQVVERETHTTDGRTFLIRLAPYRTEEDRIQGVVISLIDISERKAAEERLRIAAEADAFRIKLSDAITPLAEPAAIQAKACRLLGEHLHTDRAYFVEARVAEGITVVRQDYTRGDLFSLAGIYPLSDFDWTIKLYSQGRPVVVNDVWTAGFIPEEAKAPSAAAHISWIAIPLVKGGVVAGSLCVANMQPHEWTQADIAIARETAERLWDAVERVVAEEAVQKSEAKYRALFNSMDEGYILTEIIFDDEEKPVDIRYLEANPAAVKMTGTELIGKTMCELDPGFEPHWVETFGRVAKTGIGERHELPATPIGAVYSFYVFKVGAPNERKVAAVYLDVTERRQAEEAVRRAAEMDGFRVSLSDALRPLADPLLIQEAALRFAAEHLNLDRLLYNEIDADVTTYTVRACYIREGFAAYGGMQPMGPFTESVRGLQGGITKVVYDVQTDKSFSPEERAICADIGVRAFVTVPLLKNGRWVLNLVAHSSTPRLWPPQELRLLEETAERTWAAVERAQAEEALRASEAKYRALFQSIDEGFALIEFLAGEKSELSDFRFVEVNEAFERQTGNKDVVGKKGSEVNPGLDAVWIEVFGEIFRTGEAERFERYHQETDRWYDVFATRVGGTESRQVCVAFADVTERKRRETRQAFRVQLADALRPLTDPLEIQSTSTRLLGEHLGADWVLYFEAQDSEYVVGRDYTTEPPSRAGRYPIEPFGKWIIGEYHAGRTAVTNDIAADDRLDARARASYAGINLNAFISVPLVKEGRFVAGFAAMTVGARAWARDEIGLVEEMAERTWAAVERARAEEALQHSEERMQRVLETEAVGVIFFNYTGEVINANNAFLAMTGYTREDVDSGTLTWQQMTPRQWIAESEAQMKKLMQTGRIGPYEKEYLMKDGSRRWMLFAGRDLGDGTISEYCIDVTDRVRAEEAVRKSEAKYSTLFNSIDEGFCIFELQFNEEGNAVDWIYQEANPGFEAQTGYVNAVGRRISELQPDLERSWFEQFAEVARTGEPARFVQYTEAMNRWYDVYAFRIGAAGEHRVSLLFTDISERKYIENALRESEARLRAFVTASSDAVYQMNADWTEMRSLLGRNFMANTESPSSTWLDIYILPEDQQYVMEVIGKAIRTKQPFDLEHHVLRIDGTTGWTHSRAIPLLTDAGAITGWFGTARDITERRQAEEFLRMTEERYRTALQSADMGAWDWDVVDDKVRWNDQHFLLLGLAPEDRALNADFFLQFVHPDDLDFVSQNLMRAVEETGHYQADAFRVIRADGVVRWMTGYGRSVAWKAGKSARMVGVMFDITERKLLEQQKEEFIGIASHELRTPVTSIKAYTEILGEIFADTGDGESVALMQKLDVQVDRLTALIHALLDTTRITGGRLELQKKTFAIDELIAETAEPLQRIAGSQHIELRLQAGIPIHADRERIRQVIINLVSNAIKYAPGTERIVVQSAVHGGELSISVRDFGIGIDAAEQQQVFERFFRAGGPNNVSGLGLGLFISASIVREHGGRIWVESKKGEGATFWFTLPLAGQ